MQRDKRGRFVKKAQGGTQITNISLNKPLGPLKTTELQVGTYDPLKFEPFDPLKGSSYSLSGINFTKNPKIKYTIKDGKMVDFTGKEIDPLHFRNNPDAYEYNFPDLVIKTPSAGMQIDDDNISINKGSIDKTKLANILELTRAGIGASVNNKIAERALEAEKPLLQNISESHRAIYGDYRAKIEGEKAAAQLRNFASKPITSDGALQQQMMMEAQIKGQDFINQGITKDDAVRRQTQEMAWQQNKENQQQRQAVTAANQQAMLMSDKNKAQIENMRDSANYSQVIEPYLSGSEQRLRQKAAGQDYYQEYYNEALVNSDVWHNYSEGLTPKQLELRNLKNTGGATAVEAYLKEHPEYETDWNQLNNIMRQQVVLRTAALREVTIDPRVFGNSSGTNNSLFNKKGGTIYKAKLTKRTKDNDRTARSIESSKKIAAKFLEKAIDSLYTYDQVELIAKPKKKRKYQAGGGLPFVGFTPVFATSETGTPKVADTKKSKEADLTTKDILELLKDIDGLPSDINAIQTLMSNFIISDSNDPLGLDSSSSIASRYISLIGKIKIAKSNKEWYDKAYEKLRDKNALNELAVDSHGSFIGMNQEGDFNRFTAAQIASGDVGNYKILTNSELLDIRANTPLAPFDANMIMEAANGVGMDQIIDHINKVIQNLGSEKTQTQVFGDQSKEVLEGLRHLQYAAQEVGQDLSISQLYEASVFSESQANQADLALNYLYQTLPVNMQSLLFVKAGSAEGARQLIKSLVDSKLSKTIKLEFSPKNKPGGSTSSKKTGNVLTDGLEMSPAQLLQQGFGEPSLITIQDSSPTGLQMEAVALPITSDGNKNMGAITLEDVAGSQFGGVLDFSNASMGGALIPFEGRRNVAVDGSKLYSMNLPVDYQEYVTTGNIVPDLNLIDKVNALNKQIQSQQISDIATINQMYQDAGLPVYYNEDGTINATVYRRFGVLNGTALDNAFGKAFVASRYLKEVDDEDIINGAISIMNHGRNKEDKIEYDAKSFFNFGGLLGDYDSVYQGTVFIPISNNVFSGIAGSGETITPEEANLLEAKQQQYERVSATYKNPGQLQ